MKFVGCAVFLVCALHWAGASPEYKNAPNRDNINSVLTNRCVRPSPVEFDVNELGVPVPRPARGIKLPSAGRLNLTTIVQLMNTRTFTLNPNFQRMSPPPALDIPAQECPNPVPDTPDPEMIDVADLFLQRYIEEGLNGSSFSIFSPDVQSAVRRTFDTLDCRVSYNWIDAGPSYFPRYMSAGFCRGRRCSVPDRSNFLCRADQNPNSMGSLSAFRFDCCWDGRVFDCGWTQVDIPITCDCDCACGSEENLALIQRQDRFNCNSDEIGNIDPTFCDSLNQ